MPGRHRTLVVAAVCLTALTGSALTHAAHARSQTRAQTQAQPSTPVPDPALTREVFAEDGTILRAAVVDPLAVPPNTDRLLPALDTEVVAIQEAGSPRDSFDLVILGDGYTAGEMNLYHQQVVDRWRQLSAVDPFSTLSDRINVWQVNVVSAESGTDNGTGRGERRDTALDSGFWCQGIERLLCVNDAAAARYAKAAPEADQVVVLVNTTKYGGAGSGRIGGVAVASGGNERSSGIIVHELGHSIGGLADEYGGAGVYSGGEPDAPNVTIADEATLRARKTTWWNRLGQRTPDGGTIGLYEGGLYRDRGIYRPSADSVMRTIGRPFNAVGLDVMTKMIMARCGRQ